MKVILYTAVLLLALVNSCVSDKESSPKQLSISNTFDNQKFTCVGKTENQLKIGIWEYKLGDSTILKDWDIIEVDSSIECNVLRSWKVIPNSKYQFFSFIDTTLNDSNEFCVVLSHHTSTPMKLLDYTKLSYEVMATDTMEQLLFADVKKLEFKNKEAIYGEYTTQILNSNYKVLFYYCIANGRIYDFTYKIRLDRATLFEKRIFGDFVSGYRIQGNPMLNMNDELTNIQLIIFDEE